MLLAGSKPSSRRASAVLVETARLLAVALLLTLGICGSGALCAWLWVWALPWALEFARGLGYHIAHHPFFGAIDERICTLVDTADREQTCGIP